MTPACGTGIMKPVSTATDQTSDGGGTNCCCENTCPGTALIAQGAAYRGDQMRTKGGDHGKWGQIEKGSVHTWVLSLLQENQSSPLLLYPSLQAGASGRNHDYLMAVWQLS